MGRYFCRQCHHSQDDLMCPGCFTYLSLDPDVIDAYFLEKGLLPEPPASGHIGCIVCVAHWGDTMVNLAYCKWVLDKLGQAQCDALYYGRDPNTAEFIGAQPWIKRIYCAPAGNNYSKYTQNVMNRLAPASDWVHLLKEEIPDLPPAEEMYGAGITNYHTVRQRRVLPVRFELPHARRLWAADFLRRVMKERGLTAPPVFLHPVSTWSAPGGHHWPHWHRAIEWLLENTPHTYLLTGVNTELGMGEAYPQHERLINAVNVCPTNMENLALAEMCGAASPHGCVTTCNSVAVWSASQGFPSLILGNQALYIGLVNPFRRYFDRAPNTFLPVDASFEQFVEAATAYFAAAA
jgi:hypothetical protein